MEIQREEFDRLEKRLVVMQAMMESTAELLLDVLGESGKDRELLDARIRLLRDFRLAEPRDRPASLPSMPPDLKGPSQ